MKFHRMTPEATHNALLFRLRVFLCFKAGHNTAEIARRTGATEAHVHNTMANRNGDIELAIIFAREQIAKNRRAWGRQTT